MLLNERSGKLPLNISGIEVFSWCLGQIKQEEPFLMETQSPVLPR